MQKQLKHKSSLTSKILTLCYEITNHFSRRFLNVKIREHGH